jgi:predicted TIM-barrel fold metal-dependent hydrolase
MSSPTTGAQSALVRESVRRIGRAGLTFDMNFLGRTLTIARERARACDEMQLVLDPCGPPDIAGGAIAEWRRGMAGLAELPHVAVRFSGRSACCTPVTADAQVLAPRIDTVIALFGTRRIVWGSDWPVANLGRGMAGRIAPSHAVLRRLSPDEAADIAWRKACRIDGVAPP